jgi:hypothetical protein
MRGDEMIDFQDAPSPRDRQSKIVGTAGIGIRGDGRGPAIS